MSDINESITSHLEQAVRHVRNLGYYPGDYEGEVANLLSDILATAGIRYTPDQWNTEIRAMISARCIQERQAMGLGDGSADACDADLANFMANRDSGDADNLTGEVVL
jgi:hypothetical protein